jgi:cell division protein FtsL
MKKIRLRTVFIYALAVLAGSMLLQTSQNVQQSEAELAAITADVNREQDSIRILKTEWAFLNNPGRLETLARQYLKLSPPDPGRIATDSTEIPAKIEPPVESPCRRNPFLTCLSLPPNQPRRPSKIFHSKIPPKKNP